MTRRGAPARRGWVRAALVLALVALLGGRWLAVTTVERLWAHSLGAGATHAAIAQLRLTLLLLAFAVAALWCTGNLYLIYRSIGSVQVPRRLGNLEIVEAIPRRYLLLGTLALGFLMAALLSYGARDWWEAFALPGAGSDGAVRDPLLNRELSYYLFTLPWQRTLQGFFTRLSGVVALLAILLYTAVGAVRWSEGRLRVTELARTHIGGLLTVFAVALFFGFRLDPAEYVAGLHMVPYDTILVDVRIPVARMLGGVALAVGAASLAWVWLGNVVVVLAPWAGLLVAWFVGSYVVPGFAAAARAADRRVPAEVAEAQRQMLAIAYGFAPRDTVLDPPAVPDPELVHRHGAELSAAAIWDPLVLADVLNRVATTRSYDRFTDPTLTVRAGPRDVAIPLYLAAREVDLLAVRAVDRAVSWDDAHGSRYAFATGAVAVRADATSETGAPLFVTDLAQPSQARVEPADLPFAAPEIRFTPGAGSFVVLPAVAGEVGFRAGGWGRRLALAWVLQSAQLVSSEAVTPSSRILWRRAVASRLEHYAPFARFGVPYAAVVGDRLHWLAEGYVRAEGFPLSVLARWREQQVRYLRAGLLGVVDAHSGETAVYLLDDPDPLTAGWAELAPDIVRPADQLPDEVRSHVQYPAELFQLQLALLLREPDAVLPALPVRRAVSLRLGTAPADPQHATEPVWLLATFPGDAVLRLRLRSVVESGEPQRLAAVVDGVVRDGRPAIEVVRLATPLGHPGPSQFEHRAFADDTRLSGPVKTQVFPEGVVTIRSRYASPGAPDGTPRIAEVAVRLGPVTGRADRLDEALRRARLALQSPAARNVQWAELREWFDRMDAARVAGDWAAFGRAYEQLRQLLGAAGR